MSREVAKLNDRVLRELTEKLRKMKAEDAHVKVGVLASQGGSAPVGDGEITLVELAAIHEFGSPAANIPERSFIRGTLREGDVKSGLTRLIGAAARAIVAEKAEVKESLDKIGAWTVAQIKRRIKAHIEPPLKQKTIDAKGSSTPLIDTGQLINAITWETKS